MTSNESEDEGSEPDVAVCRRHRPISDGASGKLLAERGYFGTKRPEVAELLGNQLLSSCYWPTDLTPLEASDQLQAVLIMVAKLGPRNEQEAMLAVQNISVHNAAMECIRRAMLFDASLETADVYLKQQRHETCGQIQAAD